MQHDRPYFYRRAEEELRMAKNAASPQAVRVHYHLAGHYLDRAFGGASNQPTASDQLQAPLGPAVYLSHSRKLSS